MADVTNLMTFRSGANQHVDRPFDIHVWDVLMPDALIATGDTFLLPTRFGRGTYMFNVGVQVITVSNATTPTLGIRQASVNRTTGVQTLLGNILTGISLTAIAYNFGGSGTTTYAELFNSADMNNEVSDGRLLITITKASAGTAQTRCLFTAICGRNEY